MGGNGDFLPSDNPTLVQSQVLDCLRKQADGTMTSLEVGRTIYEFAMFAKNRKIVLTSDGISVLGDLLRARDDEVVDYGCRIAAFFALDGPEVCASMKDLGVHRRALELLTSSNSTVQSEAVNLVYWLAQDPESKQFLIDQNVATILADAQVTAKDLTVAKFLSHCSNAVLPTAKSAGELANLVEQSSLTSSIRAARQTLLSGAALAAPVTSSKSPVRSRATKETPEAKATQPYYTPKTGKEDEDEVGSSSLSAPKAAQAASNEAPLQIDQVKVTFSLSVQNRKRLKKVLISGNIQELGMWAPKKAATMFQNARGDYEFEILLPSWRREFEYKYAVVERTADGKDNEDFVWESGFIRKCKLDNSRLQKVEDSWEGADGLGEGNDQRGRSVTEGPNKGPTKAIKDDASRDRSQSGGAGWRKSYQNAGK